MEIINSTTVKVDGFADLVTILTANSQYTYVYLGVDINMPSGIRLHNDRSLIVIDGEYPIGSGTFHTLMDAGDDSGMIYKENVSRLDITFQNMTITGRDYFGMPRIANGNTDVTITYRNVTYTGPQITWHWSGLTRYIDCDITIQGAGYSPVHETAEVYQVEIGGKTTIRHNNSNAYSVFRFYYAGASITVLAGAEVEISTRRDFLFHVYTYPPQVTIQPRASLTLTTQRGISRSDAHRFASFLVDENASFRHIQLSDADGSAALYIDGAFTVNKGARVYMQADFTSSSGTRRLVQFTTIASAVKGLYLNNPKSFVLYNRGPGTAVYFSNSMPFVFISQQVNFWRDAGMFPAAGTFDDPPLYPWHNPDWSDFEIRGSATTNSTTIDSTTLPPTIEPPLSNLQLHNARVLSVGELPLIVNPVVNDQTPVNGTTDPSANIKVVYTEESVTHTLTGTADGAGLFSIPTPAPLTVGTTVAVSANVPFLYITVTKTVVDAGELYIESAPTLIQFVAPSISASPVCIFGRAVEESVVVIDRGRPYPSQWELMVSIDGPMHCDDPSLILAADVIFVPENSPFDDEEPLVPGVYTRVYVGGPEIERTEVKWEKKVGILLHLTGKIRLGEKYNANLLWLLRPLEP